MMSSTGLDVFDKTLQTTNIWLDEIMDVVGPDRQAAWKVLSVVLHKLRDRLPVGLAAHLGAQLPLLVRGVYYDQFEPAKQPTNVDSFDDFVQEVSDWLADIRPVDAKDATRIVFTILTRHVSDEQIANVKNALPRSIRFAFETAPEVVARAHPASTARMEGHP